MPTKWLRKEFGMLLNKEAPKWLNTPYKHMGKTKNGCDCLGLVIGIFSNIGVKIPEVMYTKYSTYWNLGDPFQYEKNIKTHCTETSNEKHQGDLCAFTIRNRGINHIGIWLDRHTFIHTCALNRTTEISNIYDRFWEKHYKNNWRINLLSDYIKE